MVAIAGLPYAVTLDVGALDSVGDVLRKVTPVNRAVVITDETVAAHYAQRVASSFTSARDRTIIALPAAGEQLKNRETWAQLTDRLLNEGFGRDTTVVALGGGVVGDLAGFVAATYMRGIPYIQVPTSLLAMVDASVGGKTGVDTHAGKNLVGAFHQPAAVIIDPAVLRTLPVEHLRAGFAEMVKHGVIADANYFERAALFADSIANGAERLNELGALIERSVQIKASIVARDERENGVRKVLNFGHTIGHALEALTGFTELHGMAVAMGLVVEARLAEKLGIAQAGTTNDIERVCRAAGLPKLPAMQEPDVLIGYTHSDKKARSGRVEYALPKRIGEMAGENHGWTIPVDDDIVREVLIS